MFRQSPKFVHTQLYLISPSFLFLGMVMYNSLHSLCLQEGVETFLRDKALQRDFWAVNNFQDNREMLQTLIGEQNFVLTSTQLSKLAMNVN